MTHFSQCDNFSTAARVLGALFFYAPDSAEASAMVSALKADGWQAQWPLPEADRKSTRLNSSHTAASRMPSSA